MSDALAKNRALYTDLWRHYALFPHDGWHAWREIAPFVDGNTRALEIGPGKLPHLPASGTVFMDLSMNALAALRDQGGLCVRGTSPLPFADSTFDLVCMFEVLEHVPDDRALLVEIARVLKPGGHLFLGTPMNPGYFTYYDGVMGHERRYLAAELREKLQAAGFVVERGCARHDRMDRWFGWVFGIGVRYFPRLTARIVAKELPRFAALPHDWRDGDPFLDDAERMGGVTLRARKDTHRSRR